MAIALLPLIVLQGDVTRSLARQDAAWDRLRAEQNALAFLADHNPMAQPEGQIRIGDDVASWTSAARAAPRIVAGYATGDGDFEVALYDVTVITRDANGRLLAETEAARLGWRRIGAGRPARTEVP